MILEYLVQECGSILLVYDYELGSPEYLVYYHRSKLVVHDNKLEEIQFLVHRYRSIFVIYDYELGFTEYLVNYHRSQFVVHENELE